MEADRNIKQLRQSHKAPEKDVSKINLELLSLDELLEAAYGESIPYFAAKPNPNLLLMMLYHYYVYSTSVHEGWGPTIFVLEKIDPVITDKAHRLANAKQSRKSK